MGFNTNECAWSQTSVTALGRKFVGIRGFEYKTSQEKEAIYGAGNTPIDIQRGNIKYEGHLKLLKYEVDMLNDAAYAAGFTGGIVDVPGSAILITVNYKKDLTSPTRTAIITGIEFTELPNTMDQGAKMTEITLPFVAMKIQTT